MIFTSLTFLLVYFPLVFICHTFVKNIRIKNVILLIFSLIFYTWGEPKYIFILLFSVLFNYAFAIIINLLRNNIIRKSIFIFALIVNLGSLFFFKYTNFVIFNINRLFNININLLDITLPIGISFYTFQILSYLIDVYNKKVDVQYNVLSLGTYIILFPQLVAGPIVRYSTIKNELDNRSLNINDIYSGAKRFVIGLSKKVLLANQMGLIVDSIYADLSSTSTVYMWIASLAYMFQIYYDFSGYSDMAIGMGNMLGFHFNENFNYPYMANSITDFWRRWHISLSTWFKDYVYIPLGGNKKGLKRQIINILIVWTLTGIWHGAQWNFVIWGLYFAILLIIEKMLAIKTNVLYRIFTLLLIFFGWVIFRVDGLSQLLIVLRKMFIFDGMSLAKSITLYPNLFIPILFFIPSFYFSKKHNYNKIPIYIQDAFIVIMFILCIIAIVSASYNPFIYFRF